MSWPSASAGYNLYQSDNLANPDGWSAFGGTVNDNGLNKGITITSPAGNQFFRLGP